MKRVISFLLAVVMLVGMLPMVAKAYDRDIVLGKEYILGNRDFTWPVKGHYNIQSCFF